MSTFELERRPAAPAAAVYIRNHGCSIWVANALRALDDRDVIDGFNDVEALCKAVIEREHSATWATATTLAEDPSTSYWLRSALRDVQARVDAGVLPDVQELLCIARDRVERAWRGHIPLDALVDCNSLERDAGD